MAIKISGTTVIDDTRDIVNINDMTVSGNAVFSSTSAINIPSGTTAQRPGTPSTADFRWNTDEKYTEVYNGTEWVPAAPTELIAETFTVNVNNAIADSANTITCDLSKANYFFVEDPQTDLNFEFINSPQTTSFWVGFESGLSGGRRGYNLEQTSQTFYDDAYGLSAVGQVPLCGKFVNNGFTYYEFGPIFLDSVTDGTPAQAEEWSIRKWTVSTAYDATTKTSQHSYYFVPSTEFQPTNSQAGGRSGSRLIVAEDETVLTLIDNSATSEEAIVTEYEFGTTGDLSTLSAIATKVQPTSKPHPQNIIFNLDGTKAVVLSSNTFGFEAGTLDTTNTPFRIDVTNYSGITERRELADPGGGGIDGDLSQGAHDAWILDNPTGHANGTVLYLMGADKNTTAGLSVYQFDLPGDYEITSGNTSNLRATTGSTNFYSGTVAYTNTSDTCPVAIHYADQDTIKFTLGNGYYNNENGSIGLIDLPVANTNVNGLVPTHVSDNDVIYYMGIQDNEKVETDACFGDGGRFLYFTTNLGGSTATGRIDQYEMSTPYDLKTAGLVRSEKIQNVLTGVAKNPERIRRIQVLDAGRKMFLAHDEGREIGILDLNEPFNISTANTSSQKLLTTDTARKATLSRNGKHLYTWNSGLTGPTTITQKTLAVAYDISGGATDQSIDITSVVPGANSTNISGLGFFDVSEDGYTALAAFTAAPVESGSSGSTTLFEFELLDAFDITSIQPAKNLTELNLDVLPTNTAGAETFQTLLVADYGQLGTETNNTTGTTGDGYLGFLQAADREDTVNSVIRRLPNAVGVTFANNVISTIETPYFADDDIVQLQVLSIDSGNTYYITGVNVK